MSIGVYKLRGVFGSIGRAMCKEKKLSVDIEAACDFVLAAQEIVYEIISNMSSEVARAVVEIFVIKLLRIIKNSLEIMSPLIINDLEISDAIGSPIYFNGGQYSRCAVDLEDLMQRCLVLLESRGGN